MVKVTSAARPSRARSAKRFSMRVAITPGLVNQGSAGNHIIAFPAGRRLFVATRHAKIKASGLRGRVVAIEKSKDPGEFLDFERAGWSASIVGYDDAFGGVSRQTVGPTLDAANVRAGSTMLDVCCGPGMLAEGAVRRGAHATGLDFPDVVALA